MFIEWMMKKYQRKSCDEKVLEDLGDTRRALSKPEQANFLNQE